MAYQRRGSSDWSRYWDRVRESMREWGVIICSLGFFISLCFTAFVKIVMKFILDISIPIAGWEIFLIIYVLWLVVVLLFILFGER